MKKKSNPAIYKLIKTTKDNVIIRKDGTKEIAVLRGVDQKLLSKNKVENKGLCLKLSEKLLASKYIAGTFDEAHEAAKALLEEEVPPAVKGS
ncbi:MAG: hypothetical protein AAF335_04385 [Bacteroidota bacterium]